MKTFSGGGWISIRFNPDFVCCPCDFLNVSGDCIAWQSLLQLFDQFASCGGTHFKVGGTVNAIQLMQVIGDHTGIDQPFTEVFERLDTIIDPAQQHGLIQSRDPGANEFPQGLVTVIKSSNSGAVMRSGNTIGKRE